MCYNLLMKSTVISINFTFTHGSMSGTAFCAEPRSQANVIHPGVHDPCNFNGL